MGRILHYVGIGLDSISATGDAINETCSRCMHIAYGLQTGNHTSQKTCGIDSKTPASMPPSGTSTGACRVSTPANHPLLQKKIPLRPGHLYIFRFSNSDRNKRRINNGVCICVPTGTPQKISCCGRVPAAIKSEGIECSRRNFVYNSSTVGNSSDLLI